MSDLLHENNADQDVPAVHGKRADREESAAVWDSWDAFLPHARRRLIARAVELQSASSTTIARRDQEHLEAPAVKHSEISEEPVVDFSRGAALRRPERALPEMARPGNGSPQPQPSRHKYLNARVGGAIASAMAHLLIIFLLALVTLQVPGPPAGMSFQAVSPDLPNQAVEVSQAISAEAPPDSESMDPVETDLDPATDLAETIHSSVQGILPAGPPASAAVTSFSGAAQSISAVDPGNASASFYGAAASGNCFCYVIDISGSMRGGPWEAARAELFRSLASFNAKQRFYIVVFKGEIDAIPMPGEREPAVHALYATPENLEHARRWILGLQVGGSGASPKEALGFALEKEPDAIYLLTDGVTRVKDVPEFVRQKNRVYDLIHGAQAKVPIHTIAFYSLAGQQLLRQLAAENGGQFIYVPEPARGK